MRTNRSFLVVLVPALTTLACRGPLRQGHFEEIPVGSGTWVAVAGAPGWVGAMPTKPGYLRLVVESRSNLRSIAVGNLERIAEKQVAERVLMQLRTAVTAPEAQAAAAAAPTALRVVHRACCDEEVTRDPVPGNTLATAWGLYEASIADLVEVVAEPHRAIARSALEK